MSRRVALVRHGPPDEPARGRLFGSTDLALGDGHGAELASLAGTLRALGGTRYFASPLRRARETAEAVLGQPLPADFVDSDLREVDFGHWEGKTWAEVAASEPAAAARWASGDATFAFPGGESLRDFGARVGRVAARLAADEADTVVAFTHAGVIRHLLCHYLDLPEARHPLLFELEYAAVTLVKLCGDKGVLAGLNLGPTPGGA
jgi:alpha-ribazole phosphatase